MLRCTTCTNFTLLALILYPSVDIPGIASASLGNASISFDDTAALTLRRAIDEALGSRKLKKGGGSVLHIREGDIAQMSL